MNLVFLFFQLYVQNPDIIFKVHFFTFTFVFKGDKTLFFLSVFFLNLLNFDFILILNTTFLIPQLLLLDPQLFIDTFNLILIVRFDPFNLRVVIVGLNIFSSVIFIELSRPLEFLLPQSLH